VDDLVFKIYANSRGFYVRDVMMQGPAFRDRSAVDYVALHGSVAHEGEPLSFSPLDLAGAFSSDPDRWHFLTNRLQQYPTLFWGYSLADAGVLQALNPTTVRGRSYQPRWIVLANRDAAAVSYFEALGFQAIFARTEAILDWLSIATAKRKPEPPRSAQDSRQLFRAEAIPDIGNVPVRPIQDFYSGSAPTWYDVFSGRLHRTTQFYSVLDAVSSGKSLMVIGIPACGKTTVMMQVAAHVTTSAHKLVLTSVTSQKAQLVLNRLRGDRALVFLDDATDNIEAVEMFLGARNIQLVGFERDYYFEIVSHRIDRSRCSVIDVSDLTLADIQQIYERIPTDVRKPRFIQPEFEHNAAPSLYEVVALNTIQPTLGERFGSVLAQLKTSDPRLHDLLVMSCYLHSCRVPVSYDTASAFLRNENLTPEQVLDLMSRLGSMVVDYGGDLAGDGQDYFIPRSMIMSEAVLQRVPAVDFRRVYETFHENVSPIRTCAFDVFRRRGFDCSFALRAFPEWKNGKEFYERIMFRDQSPYLLQQEALYLSHKKRFKEAFAVIDEAVQMTRNRNPTIRHSHAIILFQANINGPANDPVVVQTLQRSMTILKECYEYDKRKTYHALKFADHALRYREIYGGAAAAEYLQIAVRWLQEEVRRTPWNRDAKRLLNLVRNATLAASV